MVSCSFESEGIHINDTKEDLELYDYYVDEYGNEGIVAFIMTSSHELKRIAVVSIDESIEMWGPMNDVIYEGEVTQSITSQPEFGVAMHQAMKAIGIKQFPAQYWCDIKNGENKSPYAGSWRLPTRKELLLIFGQNGEKVDALNSALIKVDGCPISDTGLYWSCVEDFDGLSSFAEIISDYDPENRAIVFSSHNAGYSYKDRWIKKNKYYVRAIKYIYYKE